MTAQYLGSRDDGFACQALYRLSEPLADVGPDSRIVVVVSRPGQADWLTRGVAWEDRFCQWHASPQRGSWVRCYAGLSARDEAFAWAEIAAAHGNWSA